MEMKNNCLVTNSIVRTVDITFQEDFIDILKIFDE